MSKLTIHRDNEEIQEPPRVLRYEIDPAAILHSLLKRRRLIAAVTVTVGVIAAVIMLLTPNRYTSTATILPSGKGEQVSALRAMVGMIGGAALGDENSSALYPVILRSNLIADSVLQNAYTFEGDGELLTITLAEYIGKDNPDRLRRALAGMTTINSNTQTGEISVSVETEYPCLSQAVVTRYLEQLERFNLFTRRSEARERVRYLTREVDERRGALAEAEDLLGAYQSHNRNWAATTDPVILKEVGRLRREVEIKTQTLAYLMQEFEAAKLDAQKDVPVVRILDQASLPTLKSGPRRTVTVLLSGAISFFMVVCGILGFEVIRQIVRGSHSQMRTELKALTENSFPRSVGFYRRIRNRSQRETISVDK